MKQITFKPIGNTVTLSDVMSMCKTLAARGYRVSISYAGTAGITTVMELPDEWKRTWSFEKIMYRPQFTDKRVRVDEPND